MHKLRINTLQHGEQGDTMKSVVFTERRRSLERREHYLSCPKADEVSQWRHHKNAPADRRQSSEPFIGRDYLTSKNHMIPLYPINVGTYQDTIVLLSALDLFNSHENIYLDGAPNTPGGAFICFHCFRKNKTTKAFHRCN